MVGVEFLKKASLQNICSLFPLPSQASALSPHQLPLAQHIPFTDQVVA